MLKDFFYLQRNDRQAIILLLSIIAIATTIVIIVGEMREPTASTALPDSTTISQATKEHPLYYKVDEVPHELFPFDPNTADSTELLRLGLSPWQIRSIYRYRAKGGTYRTANDFARLYGITKKQFEVLRPFIHIADDYKPASDFYGGEDYARHSRNEKPQGYAATEGNNAEGKEKVYSYPMKLKPGQQIALNASDTTELQKIPGIGSYYAKAIVRYKERLGGYVSAQQLLEIEGLPESVLPYVSIDLDKVQKLNLNKLTLNQLKRHPYINFYQAREICDYRRIHGPLKSLQDLKLLTDFPPDEIERLQHYVTF